MTYADAVRKARQIANRDNVLVYVIHTHEWEQEQPFDTATDEELSTHYNGTPDSRIMYCTAGDPERLDT